MRGIGSEGKGYVLGFVQLRILQDQSSGASRRLGDLGARTDEFCEDSTLLCTVPLLTLLTFKCCYIFTRIVICLFTLPWHE